MIIKFYRLFLNRKDTKRFSTKKHRAAGTKISFNRIWEVGLYHGRALFSGQPVAETPCTSV
jgi:hypothetical protein